MKWITLEFSTTVFGIYCWAISRSQMMVKGEAVAVFLLNSNKQQSISGKRPSWLKVAIISSLSKSFRSDNPKHFIIKFLGCFPCVFLFFWKWKILWKKLFSFHSVSCEKGKIFGISSVKVQFPFFLAKYLLRVRISLVALFQQKDAKIDKKIHFGFHIMRMKVKVERSGSINDGYRSRMWWWLWNVKNLPFHLRNLHVERFEVYGLKAFKKPKKAFPGSNTKTTQSKNWTLFLLNEITN